jgi:hypothetical protein
MSEQKPPGKAEISVSGRLFFKKERRRNVDSSGISCGIVLGCACANIQIMAPESEIYVIGRISA